MAKGDIVSYLESNNTNVQIEDADGDRQRAVLVGQAGGSNAGIIIQKEAFSSMGERSSIGITPQGEDMWEGVATEIPIPPSIGEQMTVVSDDDADNGAAATGVLTVRIEYLDENGAEQKTDVILNGTGAVDTTPTNIAFVNDFYALTVGSNLVAEGNIIIYKKGSASTIYNMIEVGGNKSLVINRMVPAGKTLFITGWIASEAKDKVTSYRLRATCDPAGENLVQGFLFKRAKRLKGNAPFESMNPPIKICSGAIVKISAWVDVAGGEGSASFNGYLE